MAEPRLLYLSRTDVERVALDMPTIIELLDTAFREKGDGRVEMPPKPGIHPRPESFIHAMPASIPAMHAAGVKWVSGFPANPARGLPYISGLVVLNDDDTGLPLAVMDCTWITAYRTGAATALAARHLARPDSETVAILGCGVQGRTNLIALAAPVRLAVIQVQSMTAMGKPVSGSLRISRPRGTTGAKRCTSRGLCCARRLFGIAY